MWELESLCQPKLYHLFYFHCTTIIVPSILVAGVTLPRGVGLGHVRAAYDHTERGENQMTFVEGDLITTIGTSSDGWQYGQNTRTRQ